MIGEHIFKKRGQADPDFRWRGGDISRVEAFSDGVFAITITLLVVSTSAPSSFYDLWLLIKDLPAFMASFILIMLAWHSHYLFFRRYGLEDNGTTALNAVFLFMIMFFAFPLKFMCVFLWQLIIGGPVVELFILPEGFYFPGQSELTSMNEKITYQLRGMMYLYGIGHCGVFGILGLLGLRAYIFRHVLELDDLEIIITQNNMWMAVISVVIGLLSISILLLTKEALFSGLIYFLLAPMHGWMGWYSARRVKHIKSA